MLFNELKLIFLILLIQNLKAQNFTPFKCFEKEAKQLEEETPMRLVVNDETIYLFYRDRIFKFDVPFVFQEYADYGENYTAIIIKPAFELFIENFSVAKTVLNLVGFIYGYVHEIRSNEKISYVIYSDHENASIYDIQFKRLKFNDLPGELGELDDRLIKLIQYEDEIARIVFIHIDDENYFKINY